MSFRLFGLNEQMNGGYLKLSFETSCAKIKQYVDRKLSLEKKYGENFEFFYFLKVKWKIFMRDHDY